MLFEAIEAGAAGYVLKQEGARISCGRAARGRWRMRCSTPR